MTHFATHSFLAVVLAASMAATGCGSSDSAPTSSGLPSSKLLGAAFTFTTDAGVRLTSPQPLTIIALPTSPPTYQVDSGATESGGGLAMAIHADLPPAGVDAGSVTLTSSPGGVSADNGNVLVGAGASAAVRTGRLALTLGAGTFSGRFDTGDPSTSGAFSGELNVQCFGSTAAAGSSAIGTTVPDASFIDDATFSSSFCQSLAKYRAVGK